MTLLIQILAIPLFFSACASMPELFKTVDDIATDDCITVKVDRDAFQKETDVHVEVSVENKEKRDAK